MSDAYKNGRDAFLNGHLRETNPYCTGSFARDEWFAGWESMHSNKNAREAG